MTPIEILLLALAFGVVAGTQLTLRGEPENSLIGLNVAVICVVTLLVLAHKHEFLAFSADIALYLLFPGFIGVIAYARLLRGGMFK